MASRSLHAANARNVEQQFTSERRLVIGVLVALIGVACFAAMDIAADLREGAATNHVVIEAGILLVAMVGSIFMAYRLVRTPS